MYRFLSLLLICLETFHLGLADDSNPVPHGPWSNVPYVSHTLRCEWWEFWNEETESCLSCAMCPRRHYNASCTFACGDLPWIKNPFQSIKPRTKPVTPAQSTVLHKDDTEYWRRLTWGLSGALIFLVVFVPAMYGFQYLRSKRMNASARIQYVLQDTPDPDGSGDYVVIHRRPAGVVFADETNILDPRSISPLPTSEMPHTPNRRRRYHWMRRVYRPKRRMMNEYVDDVFESEDSAGSRNSSRLPLTTIPERSETESPS